MSKTSERSPRLRGVIIDRLTGWAHAQFAAWRDGTSPDLEALRAQLAQLEAASPSIFLFDFAAGCVSLRQKSSGSRHEDDGTAAELLRRARLYLRLFRHVVTGFGLEFSFPLAIDVDDHPLDDSGAPLFAFQKRAGSPLILLPDIDILATDFLISPDFEDSVAFEEKLDGAVFVGATTGDDVTREVVETLSLPRLRAAVFFRDVPDVTFHLPKIVQYDTEDTVAMIRALGVTGLPLSWQQQFGYKYLLSMDGNGATCSRVAIALKSRSVLIKYASDFQLFYFDGLEPGRNVLSVSTDQDVLDAMSMCRKRPRQAAAIAEAGRRFAREHLSRLPVMTYVARLLDGYGRTLLKQDVKGPDDVGRSCSALDWYGHVQDVGDTRPVPGGWLGGLDSEKVIEGFAIEPGSRRRLHGRQLSGGPVGRQPDGPLLRIRLLRNARSEPPLAGGVHQPGRSRGAQLPAQLCRGLLGRLHDRTRADRYDLSFTQRRGADGIAPDRATARAFARSG